MQRLPAPVREHFRTHHGLVDRGTCLAAGLSDHHIAVWVQRGEWERVHAGVYRLVAAPPSPATALQAACLAVGPAAVASHRSAAWLWGLVDRPPDQPEISVGRHVRPRLPGATVHRPRDLDPGRVTWRRAIPCTDPLRTAVDAAAVLPAPALDDLVDRSLARQLVTLPGLSAEVDRLSRRGRRGAGALRAALERRGFTGAPHPSVLESRSLRLLRRSGIEVLGTEVVVEEGAYRLDIVVAPGVAMEVDGYAHHWSPEHKARDERRRNRIRLGGVLLLVYTWRDIVTDGRRVTAEVRRAMGPVTAGR